jgi:hypothetical protein
MLIGVVMAGRMTQRDIATYFDAGEEAIELVEEGLQEMTFGEFLVENSPLTRAQLFDALREQDRHPGIPLGEVIAWLGYLPYAEIDRLLTQWSTIPVLEVPRAGR